MLINEGKDLFLTISSFSSSKEKFYDRSSTQLINDRYIPRVFLSQRSPFNDAFNRNERLCIFLHLLSYFRVKKASRLQDIANLAKIQKIHLLTLVYQTFAKLLRLSPRWYATDREEWSVRGSRGGGRRQRVRGRRRRIERCTRGGREREEGSFNRPLLCAGDIFPAHYCI